MLGNYFEKIEIKASCTDNISRQFENVDHLSHYENAPERQIREISFWATSDNGTASINFDSDKYGGIRIRIETNADDASQLRTELNDIMSGTKPWYGFICKIDFIYVLFSAVIISLILMIGAIVFDIVQVNDEPKPSSQSTLKGLAIYLTFWVGATVGAIGLNWIRKFVFPFGSFLIGQSIQRHSVMERVRWAVVVGFFVSLTASIAVSAW
ncbi:MAG: hypothetical protein Kow00114_35310 [Kiloniellaceae bacterium]